ncbi:regulatory protein, luxR family [Zhouia amylolytica]|uniref:Regulatory protein, luxR family n=1 Tax=Zhouia amylolytica TaxID=376730 RepID=A0A1I6VQX3_9FLAO|nr:helix-turn-helix transcriptional regulator [Zhouia amylolytica]SFT16122.1 regulatory protein, luxR family [Zhouia amylolytica]
MKNAFYIFLLFSLCYTPDIAAQYKFSGVIDQSTWSDNVYLSIIEDYRQTSGVYTEQIIAKTKADSLGVFSFTGNQLSNENSIYKIHVDNCYENTETDNHFNGHCNNSKQILFIANNRDTIQLPFSFDNEMFCEIVSTNPKTESLLKIDSVVDEMKYAYSRYSSEANRKLNNKKWFSTLQDFGAQLNEPLAELYIYSFLSSRTHDFHPYYIEDLRENNYYQELLLRLENSYPNSQYTHQYATEVKADKYMLAENPDSKFSWSYIIYGLLTLSLITNVLLFRKIKHSNQLNTDRLAAQLTTQEHRVLELILDNKTNKEIASEIYVSLSTVKTHINNIYKKLNVRSRAEVKAIINK